MAVFEKITVRLFNYFVPERMVFNQDEKVGSDGFFVERKCVDEGLAGTGLFQYDFTFCHLEETRSVGAIHSCLSRRHSGYRPEYL